MKKLTLIQIEEKIIKKVIKRIKSIEKVYGIKYTRRGCNRYYLHRGNELKLKREIKEKEQELLRLKSNVKK